MKVLSLLLLALPLSQGSSVLEYKPNSAYCTGNLTGLELITADCPKDEVCTFGSDMYLYGQVNFTSDLPWEVKVKAFLSLPHIPATGWVTIHDGDLGSRDICNTTGVNYLSVPAGNDAGYSCPEAGVYNFHEWFPLFGKPSGWYGSTYGYNLGVKLLMIDQSTDEEFGLCYAELRVKKGESDPYAKYSFLGGGVAVMAIAGYVYRKRRVATLDISEEDAEGASSHFELVQDRTAAVV